MKYWIITTPKLPANGMALYPVILLKNPEMRNDKVLINHEKIHLAQQLELLILPFYILYLSLYLINLIRYKNHDEAYRKLIFEKEAYQNEDNLSYLSERKAYHWLR